MKFLIYSNSFIPQAGAESFCSTRFASALAYAGHEVHVVTVDWPQDVSAEVQTFLQDSNLKVTRISPKRGWLHFIYSRIRYLTHEIVSQDICASICVVRNILKENPDTILVTRSLPFASMIVGWHCRRYAKKWIAHFCDPLSFMPRGTFWSNIRYRSMRFWLKRTIRDADAISLTCEQVKRYYHDEHGELFDRAHCIIADHVGEPALPFSISIDKSQFKGKILVHTGALSELRSSQAIIQAVDSLNERGMALTFVQCGSEDQITRDLIFCSKNSVMQKSSSPDYAMALANAADAVVVADQKTSLGYIPFIPSKFAYQLFVNKPIVAISQVGSEMWQCCQKYPTAGLFFSEIGDAKQLQLAIKKALACDMASIDRSEVCERFSRLGVVKHFTEEVAKL